MSIENMANVVFGSLPRKCFKTDKKHQIFYICCRLCLIQKYFVITLFKYEIVYAELILTQKLNEEHFTNIQKCTLDVNTVERESKIPHRSREGHSDTRLNDHILHQHYQ